MRSQGSVEERETQGTCRQQDDGRPTPDTDDPVGTDADCVGVNGAEQTDAAKKNHHPEGRLRNPANDVIAFPETTQEICRFWGRAFPTALALHLRSSSFRVNAACLLLLTAFSPRAGLALLGAYCLTLCVHLLAGLRAFYLFARRRRAGLPVRSPREIDATLTPYISLSAARLPIALAGSLLAFPEWGSLGAGETLSRLFSLAGAFLLAAAGAQALISAPASLGWQKLFDPDTAKWLGNDASQGARS